MGFWTRKKLTDVHVDDISEEHRLKRHLGPVHLITLGIGAIIGAGLFSITGIAAAESAGPAIVISFIIAGIACTLAGLCYAELASMIPLAGSAYTYAYITMGEFVAWVIGWDLILEYAIGATTVAISWSGYIVELFQDYGIDLPVAVVASPWQPVRLSDGSLAYGYINLPATLIVVFISILLIRGVRQSAFANAVMVFIKVSVVLLFIAIGFFYIKPENYVPFIPPNTGEFGEFGWSGILRAAAVVFFAYIGFDAVSTAAQEAKNPQKDMPIGIIGSLVICTILYILFSFIMTGLANYTELNVAAPVAVAVEKTPFLWLTSLTKLAILAGLTSVILVLLLGQSRIFYSMSYDGLLPPLFSRVHPTYHTPWLSSLALMVFVGGLASFAPISAVGNMTSIGTLLAFVIVCAGVLFLRYTHPEWPRTFKTPWVPYVPVLGIITCLIMMVSLELITWIRLVSWLIIGMIIYFSYSHRHVKIK